jgi:hypothetical protein
MISLRMLLAGCVIAAGVSSLPAASSRADLLFALKAAMLAEDRQAFTACFNLEGADEETRTSTVAIINRMFDWPTYHIFTTERSGSGNPVIQQNGKSYRLNGDWKFQVHIFTSKKADKGYVFPAGMVHGQCLILVAVPAKS